SGTVLIAPNEVLTASHVVYSSQYGTASNIVVTPGYSPGLSPYGSATADHFHYNQIQDPNDSISLQQSQYDYALIHLTHSFTLAGTMGIRSNYAGGFASVTGYPASQNGAQVTYTEYMQPNWFYTIYSGVALGKGSSGGPVWVTGADGSPYVVGLVSSESTVNSTGYFTQITSAAYSTIQQWLAQDAAACFAEGTRIATTRGEVAVEALAVGDIVPAGLAGAQRIDWLGHRHVDCRRHPRPESVWPVRIRADAFAPGQPLRDLLLSPDHAIFVDGRLIPVRYLVNGATIVQEARERVTYWHVELPRHDILCAEGLAVESFLDTGNRGSFDNGGPAIRLHPDFALRIWQAKGCAPLLTEGADLTALRRRLHDRAVAAGFVLTGQPDLRILADGRRLAVTRDAGKWHVRVPYGARAIDLVSRTWCPAQAMPDSADTRTLGVAIGRLWRDGQEVDLGSAALTEGWHDAETAWRWTGGRGRIALDGARSVAFTLAITGRYWLAPHAARRAAGARPR
nr:Hint domain-containing protein [Rhodospirillales bacterium]